MKTVEDTREFNDTFVEVLLHYDATILTPFISSYISRYHRKRPDYRKITVNWMRHAFLANIELFNKARANGADIRHVLLKLYTKENEQR